MARSESEKQEGGHGNATPPPLPANKRSPLTARRLRWLALIFAGVAVVFLIYFFLNPFTSSFAPKCIIRSLTGYDCPGCGSQRLIHALAHGDFRGAWDANPFIICITPLLILWIWIDADPSTYPRASRFVSSPAFIITLLIIIGCWTVARNIFGL